MFADDTNLFYSHKNKKTFFQIVFTRFKKKKKKKDIHVTLKLKEKILSNF